jgi:hypothetical protein
MLITWKLELPYLLPRSLRSQVLIIQMDMSISSRWHLTRTCTLVKAPRHEGTPATIAFRVGNFRVVERHALRI